MLRPMIARWACLGTLIASGQAFGLGTFVTDAGSGTALDASRTVFVRSADSVRMVTQVKYAGTPGKLLWLIAIPNFTDPSEDGVVVAGAPQAALDALSTSTRPTFAGDCDGMPSGDVSSNSQAESWGPTPNMALPSRIFPVQDLIDGDLAAYAADVGVTLDEAAQDVISTVIDQNNMLIAIRFDAAEVGVNKVDPIVSISFPLDAGDNIPLALYPTNTATPAGNADLAVFVLGGQRVRASLTTNELDFATVSFVSPSETNYLSAFDGFVGAVQTQMFITEQASGIDGAFGEAALDGWIGESGATFQTRLRARISGAALRANKFISLRAMGMGAYGNEHTVTGYMCAGDEPDMGMVEADMGAGGDGGAGGGAGGEGGGAGGAGGGAEVDMGVTSGGGGGDDGCAISYDAPAPWILLLGLPGLLAFRRRSR